MRIRTTRFKTVKLSLKDMLGREYVEAVCRNRALLTGEKVDDLLALGGEKVDFYPKAFHARQVELLGQVGQIFGKPLKESVRGATSLKFAANSNIHMAPQTALGLYRLGENGKLYFISKAEHYHASVGHSFPGYRLIEIANTLGIPNATHNNTRGYVTRTLEEELIRTANGIPRGDRAALDAILSSTKPKALNKVLNLETGSLAVEAALKMVLSRFYQVQPDASHPIYEGRMPVMVVMGDDDGTITGNYHGTTVLTQALRGMWPGFLDKLEKAGILAVRSVRPNNMGDVKKVFSEFEKPPYKIAAFFHELIMMNYGGRRLTKEFIQGIQKLCWKHDVPTICDEIQSCIWSPQIFMFREYEIEPTFVVVGKGIPGGEYAASRVIFSHGMDVLPQFGALVTNGQEELASLAYLITMRWAEENGAVTDAVGTYYEERLNELQAKFQAMITSIDGKRHMSALYFLNLGIAKAFVAKMNEAGLDISVQTYKADCPPSALTKMPLTMGYEAVDLLVGKMEEALAGLGGAVS